MDIHLHLHITPFWWGLIIGFLGGLMFAAVYFQASLMTGFASAWSGRR